MTTVLALASAFTVTIIVWLASVLGVFRASYRETLNDSLDAIYVRNGVLSWELLIAAKGKSVGIKQGTFLLPFAKGCAAQVRQGKRTII